ncbi:MAG: biliverdin-producing heme oxygenase [Bacteroidetes bacterium]|nr:biliverdin-producing heme oxygenase [Bacteroidota bacterium]
MLTEELKENTQEIHRAAEKKMIAALKQIETTADYIGLLSWLYGFYAPLEGQIKKQLTEDNFPGITKRLRTEYILWDIQESGSPLPDSPQCEQMPVIDSFYSALGALYVLEGSTLGGRIIAGMIVRQLDSTKSLSYFNGYGAETGNMWASFKEYLNQPCTPAQRREIISAAEDTFLTFKNWIDKHALQPQL